MNNQKTYGKDKRTIDQMHSTKKAAKAAGHQHYYTGKPCKRGHLSPRYASGNCFECASLRHQRAYIKKPRKLVTREEKLARQRAYYQENKEKLKVWKQAYYLKNKEEINKKHIEWLKNNSEYVRAYGRKKYWKDPKKSIEKSTKYYKENREKILEKRREYREKNKLWIQNDESRILFKKEKREGK